MIGDILSSNETTFGLYLILCLTFGYAIGLEREYRGKSAGIATQCLVIAGAMTFTYMSLLMNPNAPTQIAASVVTGIGFLGAGIIFHQSKDKVVNLTTAATIWMAAGVGMLIGFGYPLMAFALVVFSIIALHLPHVKIGKEKEMNGK